MFSFPINGNVVISDNVQLSDLEIWNGETTLTVYAMDIHDKIFERKFRIIDVNPEQNEERFRFYKLKFVDMFYYNMVNTYISKSFEDTKSNALMSYIEHTGTKEILESNNVEIDFDDTEDKNTFAVPANIDVLNFFISEFKKKGFRLYQTRYSVKLKKDDFNSFEEQEEFFSNNTDNDMYGWKIHDFSMKYNAILERNLSKPIEKNVKFDFNKKEDYTTQNLIDVYSTIELNETPMDTLQHTTGQKLTTQAEIDPIVHKFELEEIYGSNTILEIVVPGNFKINDIGKIVSVDLKGNPMIKQTSLEGDTFHSGKYLVTALSDRFVGDKLVQKLSLHRVDFGFVRKS